MSLYVPRAFDVDDFAAACRLIEAYPFATLVTAIDGAPPQISHLPMLIEDGLLTGHLARANPQWRHFEAGHTVAVFHGPHAYVSPSAYEHPEADVPTWNYATVHVEGRPSLLDDHVSGPLLQRLTAHFESGGYRLDDGALQRKLAGIVGFRMPMQHWKAKFKLSQNRTARDRQGVVDQLRSSGRHDELAVADWMDAAT